MNQFLVLYCPALFYSLLAACAVFMALERAGVPTTLALEFKGDVKRETRLLAQYGQTVCAAIVALLIWRIDQAPEHRGAWLWVVCADLSASIPAMLIKRLLGRVRPGRPNAGKFLGFTWKHANFRESFPSSHSASAMALTVALCLLYPRGTEIFWALALVCAGLRYIMDAHWPSDVFGGIALGYGAAHWAWWMFHK